MTGRVLSGRRREVCTLRQIDNAPSLDDTEPLDEAGVVVPKKGRHAVAFGFAAAGAIGGAVAILLMELVSVRTAYPLAVVPFATSIVLVMGTPEAGPAQPRALIGGHLVATLIGLVLLNLFGPSPWVAAAAVGVAMVAMHLTRTFHPPAGIDPLLVVLNDMPWSFLIAPVGAGAVLLAAFAFLWHNAIRRGAWPLRWL